MDCGIPFCNNGCPLGNLIPDWNDLVYRDRWREAIERLHATNNFPEFTGRLCPAPCEAACVLGINQDPVTIKQVEVEIIDRAWAEGWVKPVRPPDAHRQAGRRRRLRARPASPPPSSSPGPATTSSCSSGPTASAACCATASPSSRWRSATSTGASPRCGPRAPSSGPASTSASTSPPTQLRADFDAIVLAGGATQARDLPIPGRELDGHPPGHGVPARSPTGCRRATSPRSPITAEGKQVVIIGGGDTGADCLGTAHRQGAAIVHQFEIMPRPPEERPDATPWPTWPLIYRTSSAHEEGGERVFSVNTECFLGDDDGSVRALRAHEVEMVDGRASRRSRAPTSSSSATSCSWPWASPAPSATPLLEQLGVELDDRGNVARDDDWATNVDGVFVAGDMGRGQSLIVWAIAEGRACAAAVDRYLMGDTLLPSPVVPTTAPQR